MLKTRRSWGAALLTALVMMVVPVAPVAADHAPAPAGPVAGTGALQGTELEETQQFLGQPCFAAVRHVYGLRGHGTYVGRNSEGQEVVYRAQLGEGLAVHQGPLQVQIENAEPFHHGPYGTHGADSSCGPATAGTPVSAAFKIFAAEQAQDTDDDNDVDLLGGAAWVYRVDGSGAKVPCTGRGSFVRRGMDQGNWHADWTLDADCTVVGDAAGTPGQGVAPVGTAMTHSGFHGPCGGGCVDNFDVDFNQHLPVKGLALSVGGPTSAAVGQSVTLTAGVTNDGLPVPGAVVSFSVAGPGPGGPPAGTAVTGADGRAGFTFTAAVEGAYTVSASATTPTSPGSTAEDTHTVRFNVPAPSMTLAGPARSVTEDQVTIVARVIDDNAPVDYDRDGTSQAPLANVTVNFTVTGAGQATPSSSSATTDINGRASFSFVGDRAGDYVVAASATYLGKDTSATHPVNLGIKALSRVGAVDFPADERNPAAAVIDPAGDFAYFAAGNKVVKFDLARFVRVGAIDLGRSSTFAVIDPAGTYAYFGGSYPSQVVRVDLATFQTAGSLDLPDADDRLGSGIIDPTGRFAYFGASGVPAKVLKVDLATFQQVGALTFADDEYAVDAAVIDPAGDAAYFLAASDPARLVKVDLATFQRVGATTLLPEDHTSGPLLIDPTGSFAYLRSIFSVVKVDLRTSERIGALTLPDRPSVTSAVMAPDGRFAYFGLSIPDPNSTAGYTSSYYGTTPPAGVAKVDLNTFEAVQTLRLSGGEDGLSSAVMAPDGSHAYFGTRPYNPTVLFGVGTRDAIPSKVVKVSLTRPPNLLLEVGNDSYNTPYATPLTAPAPGVLENDRDREDGDQLTAGQASDPPGGSVTLNPDGSFVYTPEAGFYGPDTFTYTASDGMDYSAPATVTVTVGRPPDGVSSVKGNAYGYLSDVSLFGGPKSRRGFGQVTCTAPNTPTGCVPESSESPSVELPPTGASLSDTDPDGATAQYGPATIFSSGAQHVTSQGTTGPGGSVSTSTDIANVNTSEQEVFTATGLSSTCTASESGVSAKTTITGGTLRVSEGDPNVEGDDTVVNLPVEPEPNTVYQGQIEAVGDRFEYIFNEQVRNPDGSITVYAAHQKLLGPTAIGDLYIGKSECGVTATGPPPPPAAKAVADFDGDGATDVSVFRPSTGVWYLRQSTGGDRATEFGADGDVPVLGDYDGDGTTDLGIYRPSNGVWYLRQSTAGDSASQFGADGDVAVPGDYDGDGATDLGVYRPSTGVWYLRQSTAGDIATQFGAGGDVAVPGDYDGDGTTDMAVYRPSTGVWYARQSTAGDRASEFGVDGDVPVPGDYDGDGTTDLGVYRPATGTWYLRQSIAGDTASSFGVTGDVPVPGDYDGDGTTDLGVHRPETNVWYLRRSTTGDTATQFGAPGDIPLPLPAAIRQSTVVA